MRILFIEDSQRLRDSVSLALRRSGYAVDVASDGDEGLWMAQNNPYDAAILDIMLPRLDGISVIRRLRETGNSTPAIFVTARRTLEDRVTGLRCGADDYLVKPFEIQELLARVEVLCRRSYKQSSPEIRVADLTLNTASRMVQRGGFPVELPAREYAVLEFLVMRAGNVVSRSEIEEHIYDNLAVPMSNVVDSTICSLRRKLSTYHNAPDLIHTRRGQGYILEER